jgi:hypothetical protein
MIESDTLYLTLIWCAEAFGITTMATKVNIPARED